MKLFKHQPIVLMLTTICFLLTSCATTMDFLDSPVVPAAQGSAKISSDDNGNYKIEVNVTNLAEPSKLVPAREVYVVWMQSEKHGNQNIGQLKSSSGFFSSTLKGTLSTVSSYKPKKVFITAEDDAGIRYPGPQTVLFTRTY